jgi:hypothetical protein
VSDSLLSTLGPAVVVFAIVALQFSQASRRRARALAAERRAAGGPIGAPGRKTPESATARAAAVPAAPATAIRTTQPIARIPKRVEPPAAPVARVSKKKGLLVGGPRWAANAVVAAEVFGPPVAARPVGPTVPGGTLGPPSAL